MPTITEDSIRSLASFRGEGVPVTSCYLNVDGRRFVRHADVEAQLDALLRSARSRVNGTASVHDDLQRMERFVRAGLDRSRTRGLAMFSCAPRGLWKVVPLPVPVRSRVVINEQPAVGQLESVLQDHPRFGVLLVDRQRIRVFVFDLGELAEHSELVDDLPRDYDHRGERERGDVAPHVDALLHQHLKRAAEVAFAAYQTHGFDVLSLGAPDQMASEAEGLLHPYLRERLCGRIDVTPSASIDDIRRAALELEERHERKVEAERVSALRDAVGARRRAISGLKDVLAAVNDHRVDRLLVSDGFGTEGWRCGGCAALFAVGRACKRCGETMAVVEDVVEDAIDVVLADGGNVDVCVGSADLDVLGRIGAFLRY
ncbi:MAG: hypothetical protein HYX34_01375 [Actinobacteria bacterium]|nr:hypothetical protein [Actinomycetota bacterium]